MPDIASKRANIFENLEMNLVNRVEKTQMREAKQIWKLTHHEDNFLSKTETMGGVLILTRVLGHPEFEPVRKPLFRSKLIERAREQVIESER